jgi:hypothetical protein
MIGIGRPGLYDDVHDSYILQFRYPETISYIFRLYSYKAIPGLICSE